MADIGLLLNVVRSCATENDLLRLPPFLALYPVYSFSGYNCGVIHLFTTTGETVRSICVPSKRLPPGILPNVVPTPCEYGRRNCPHCLVAESQPTLRSKGQEIPSCIHGEIEAMQSYRQVEPVYRSKPWGHSMLPQPYKSLLALQSGLFPTWRLLTLATFSPLRDYQIFQNIKLPIKTYLILSSGLDKSRLPPPNRRQYRRKLPFEINSEHEANVWKTFAVPWDLHN